MDGDGGDRDGVSAIVPGGVGALGAQLSLGAGLSVRKPQCKMDAILIINAYSYLWFPWKSCERTNRLYDPDLIEAFLANLYRYHQHKYVSPIIIRYMRQMDPER